MLLAGTDKKSLMPSPTVLTNPMGLPMTPAEPNTFNMVKSSQYLFKDLYTNHQYDHTTN